MIEVDSQVGPYRVLRKIGEGGMGSVFEAVHQDIERHVAIKVLHPDVAQDQEFAARFVDEARAVNLADHPGLVQVSDYGRLPDGTAYIVMEYLRGETLGHRLRKANGPMPISEVVNLGLLIADSLAAAHDKGIVHRDLKPTPVPSRRRCKIPCPEREIWGTLDLVPAFASTPKPYCSLAYTS